MLPYCAGCSTTVGWWGCMLLQGVRLKGITQRVHGEMEQGCVSVAQEAESNDCT